VSVTRSECECACGRERECGWVGGWENEVGACMCRDGARRREKRRAQKEEQVLVLSFAIFYGFPHV